MVKLTSKKPKKWFTITAPDMFQGKELGKTVAKEPNQIIGRVIKLNLFNLTGDIKKQSIIMTFKIKKLDNTIALTETIGCSLSRMNVDRMLKRNHTVIHSVFDSKTKDGKNVRIKAFCLSSINSKESQRKAVKKEIDAYLDSEIKANTFDEFLNQMLIRRIQKRASANAKKIIPLKNLTIRDIRIKSK